MTVEIFTKCLHDAKKYNCGSMKPVQDYFDMFEIGCEMYSKLLSINVNTV